MKHTWLWTLILCILLTGCSQSASSNEADTTPDAPSEPSAKVWQVATYGGTSIKGIETAENVGFLSPATKIEKDPNYPQEQSISIHGKTYQAQLSESEIYESWKNIDTLSSCYGTLIYKTAENSHMFFVHPETKAVCGFSTIKTGGITPPEEIKSKEELQQKADSIKDQYYAHAAELQSEEPRDDGNLVMYSYRRIINGLRTNEGLTIVLRANGEVLTYKTYLEGAYDHLNDVVTTERTQAALDRIENALPEGQTLNRENPLLAIGEGGTLYLQAEVTAPLGDSATYGYTTLLFTEY